MTDEDRMYIIYNDAPNLVRLELTKDMSINYAKFSPMALFEKYFHTPKYAVRTWCIDRPFGIQLYTEDKTGKRPNVSEIYVSFGRPDEMFSVTSSRYGGGLTLSDSGDPDAIDPSKLTKVAKGNKIYLAFSTHEEPREMPFNTSIYIILNDYTAVYKQREKAYDILDLNDY